MTLAYTTYSEAGGVGKTTTAANLSVAHARGGLDVLAIGLDQQEGDLSFLLDVDDNRNKDDVDTLARHMIRRPKGAFEDLIVKAEYGIDVIPEHNSLGLLEDWLNREKEQAEEMGEAFGTKAALQRVFRENNVYQEYDVIVCDPPATEGAHLHNAINATRSLVLPIELSAKGEAAIKGLEDLVRGLSEILNIEIGVLGAIPLKYKGTNAQDAVLESLQYNVIETIGERSSLMGGCWSQQCSAFTFVRDHRNRRRDHEMETLAQFDRIAREIESQADVEASNPPEPGVIDDQQEVTL